MTLTLRPYQQDAINAVYAHLRERDNNPCVVIPTAGGKTPILATICRDAVQRWNGRVLILAHVRELLEQAAEKIHAVAPDLPAGIYSAGLKRKDLGYAVTIAGIQSVYKRACDIGPVDLVIVDECFVEGTMISTPTGDVPIEHVQPGMIVHNGVGIGKVMATSARNVRSLVSVEYSDGTSITCTGNHPIFTEAGWQQAGSLEIGSLAFGREDLRMLRHRVSAMDEAVGGRPPQGDEGTRLAQAALLLDLLLQDPRELHAFAGGSRESIEISQSEGALTGLPGRQWQTHEAPKGAAPEARRGVDSRTGGASTESQGRIAAQACEDRPRPSAAAHRDRTGWTESSIAVASIPGFPEDIIPRAKRLVRVSHHEQQGGRAVFNLHVSGHPSYFAHGILVHNCHLIPEDGEGMYRTFLADAKVVNPHLRVVGLTATPYRMKTGTICSPENILNEVCYEVGVRELIVQGYLCPLRTKGGVAGADTSGLNVRASEFVAGEVEDLMDDAGLVKAACAEIVEQTRDRHAVLIFAAGVRHGQHVARVLRTEHGVQCGFICGGTSAIERARTLERFRAGRLKYLANVNVLTTGFDAPNIDCVAMLRPTLSPGLYYQMVGRGFRLHPGKTDCLILDFGGNVLRHGPVDAICPYEQDKGEGDAPPPPAKECPACHALIHAAYAICPECGHEFPPPKRTTHDATATSDGILSGQVTKREERVSEVFYSVHEKRDAPPDAPRTMRVEYRLGFNRYISEWICFEHTGYARAKAERWWRRRSREAVPATAEQAVELAGAGAVAKTDSITIEKKAGEQYERVVGHELGEIPPRLDDPDNLPEYAGAGRDPMLDLTEDDLPF